MLKIEGTKFGTTPFEPTVASRQFASTATVDTIATSKPAEETEGCFTRLVCCFPRLVLALVNTVLAVVSTVIRTAICILTLGYYCNTKAVEKPKEVVLSEKDLRAAKIKDLEEGLKIWEKQESTSIEKGVARDELEKKYPKVFEDVAKLEVERLRLEYTRKKPENPEDAEYIKNWNEKFFDGHLKKVLNELVNGFHVRYLSNYIEHLRALNGQETK